MNQNDLATALDAVQTAARFCSRLQGALGDGALEKDDRSPVTIADFGSQALICRALSMVTPDVPVIAEEGSEALREQPELLQRLCAELEVELGSPVSPEQVCAWIDRGQQREAAPDAWTLDPIDGTAGFLRGDQYAVALARIVEGRLVLGVIGSPNLPREDGGRGVLFHATHGGGAFQRPLPTQGPLPEPSPIQVNGEEDPTQARFCESVESSHSSHSRSQRIAERLGITAEPLRMDSLTKYALVARGDVELYLRLPKPGYREKIWDHAAGVLVVVEAGGAATDAQGQGLDWSHGARLETNEGIVVTNAKLQRRVLEAVAEEAAS